MRNDKFPSGSLGYECNHQRNLKTMRGAKSNALFLRSANGSLGCPCIALVIWSKFWGHLPGVSICICLSDIPRRGNACPLKRIPLGPGNAWRPRPSLFESAIHLRHLLSTALAVGQ
jgi:hypothetical protein